MYRIGFLVIGIFLAVLFFPVVSLFADEVSLPQTSDSPTDEQSLSKGPEAEVSPQPAEASSEESAGAGSGVDEQPLSQNPKAETLPQPSQVPSEQPMQPRVHRVQPGDTLWSITTSYLSDPFYWPRVWDVNRYIKNPDLIYPGSVINLPTLGALQKAMGAHPELAREEIISPQTAVPIPSEAKITLEPQAEPTFDPALQASVGYVLSGEIGRPGVLVGGRDNKILLGEGDVVYLKSGPMISPKQGDHLVIYRNIRKIYHPKTGKYLGDLIVLLGTVELLEVDNKIMTAKILKSYNYILSGDPVAPYEAVRLPSFERTPSGEGIDVKGYVVDVKEEKVAIAQFDVVYIDRGISDGIGRGTSFRVIRDGERTPSFSAGGGLRLPSRTIAELEVITVSDHTATAKVRKSSEPIFRGDRIESLPVEQSPR